MVMSYRSGNADSGFEHNGVEAITFDETGIKALAQPLPESAGGSGVSSAPAFSAYANATQSVTSGILTKIAINTEIFDTENCFDSTTNYRFTPNVAGYYQVNGTLRATNTAVGSANVALYKNGSIYSRCTEQPISGTPCQCVYSELVYMNGTTDYLELYGAVTGGTTSFEYAAPEFTSRFSAFLAKGA